MKIAKTLSAAVLLLSTTVVLALPQSTAPANTPNAAAPTKQASPGTAQKAPAPKTQAEYDAYKAAASQTDAAKLEASATDFAQRFPDSELRAFLFQQAMGMYQQANNPDKTLEMARATLKYDPGNPVALLTAAQILAERTHDNDLDRDDRLAEANADALSALQHANEIAQPSNMTPEQFAAALSQLRGTAHEVIATVAFKKLDYSTAIKEYNAAIAEEKEHTDAVVWLRLSVAHDKSSDFNSAMDAVQKAITASEPGSQIRQLAEQEKSRLEKLASSTTKPATRSNPQTARALKFESVGIRSPDMKHLPLDNLEQAIGHQFANRDLLQQALTHSSFARESLEPAQDNEQLEFLGDAVLQLLASQELFQRFPLYREGELSKLRAHLVNANHLVHCAVELRLGEYLRLGRGEEKTGGRCKTALLADSVEAILAALYLDGGLFVARAFVLSHILEPELERLSDSEGEVLVADHKSRLQEMLRASGRPEPRYEMVGEDGPDHRKLFTMQVVVLNPGNEIEFATIGNANSKKAASQLAAQKALEHLQRFGIGNG